MSAPPAKPVDIILWTDYPEQALPARAAYAEKDRKAVIRDSRFFDSASVEPAGTVAFMGCARADEILAHYRGHAYRVEYPEPHVVYLDLADPNADANGIAPPPPAPPPIAMESADALTARIDAMDDDALRVYVRGITGEAPAEDASREDMIASVRGGQPQGGAISGLPTGSVVEGARAAGGGRNRKPAPMTEKAKED